jgi:predicted  nucleic acid-binding Zn-ribbon protein
VNEKIPQLIRLQEMDKNIDAARRSLARLTPERDALKADILALQTRQSDAKKSLTDAQVQKKNLEIEIDTKDQLVRKHSGQLNGVKSNDAYKALLSEIDAAKKEKSTLEDQVLVLMESIDALQKEQKAADAEVQQHRAEIEKKIAAVDARETEARAQIAQQQAERDAFAAAIPADARARYEAIQRGRPEFMVIVPVNGMTCGGCRTLLTPDAVNQAMKGKELVSCESCSRLLYIVPQEKPVPS